MDLKEVIIEIYIPEEYVIDLRDKLNEIGACKIGNYDNVFSITRVVGYWRPLTGSNPFKGTIDTVCEGNECKMEVRCKIEYIKEAINAIKEIHPYEEPGFNIIPIVNYLFE